ncbi:MAG: DUF2785 domain-containing protein [Marmoricola sp.]
MSSWSWQSVVADGMRVPSDRCLSDLTTELGDMLGDPDPAIRDELALPIFATWVSNGVYDDLLQRLGDGICTLMEQGAGEVSTDGVFQRSFAALVLAEIIERDTRAELLADRVVRGWGDRVAQWLVAEKDLRGFVPGKGWAHAVAHGADAIGALARSPRLHGAGLVILLDVVADRVLEPTPEFFVAGETDRLALAAMDALRRDLVDTEVLEPWLTRLAARARPDNDDLMHPYRVNGNVQSFLRAFYLQLSLAPERPAVRPDLLLALLERLRATNPDYLRPHDAQRVFTPQKHSLRSCFRGDPE